MTARRNLAAWEIIDQWVQAATRSPQGRRVTGRGLHGNGRAVPELRAGDRGRRIASVPVGGAVGAKAMTISTVGLVPEIDRYTTEGHSTDSRSVWEPRPMHRPPGTRRRPLAGRGGDGRRAAPCAAARPGHALLRLHLRRKRRRGRRRALGELIGDTPVRLDLIDVTDPTGRFQPPDAAETSRSATP